LVRHCILIFEHNVLEKLGIVAIELVM